MIRYLQLLIICIKHINELKVIYQRWKRQHLEKFFLKKVCTLQHEWLFPPTHDCKHSSVNLRVSRTVQYIFENTEDLQFWKFKSLHIKGSYICSFLVLLPVKCESDTLWSVFTWFYLIHWYINKITTIFRLFFWQLRTFLRKLHWKKPDPKLID